MITDDIRMRTRMGASVCIFKQEKYYGRKKCLSIKARYFQKKQSLLKKRL